jgi:hypothetical protein
MKKARRKHMNSGGGLAPQRIVISGGDDALWTVAVNRRPVLPSRPVPGSVLTKVHCDRELQLRLTRFIQSAPEQLGFCIASQK